MRPCRAIPIHARVGQTERLESQCQQAHRPRCGFLHGCPRPLDDDGLYAAMAAISVCLWACPVALNGCNASVAAGLVVIGIFTLPILAAVFMASCLVGLVADLALSRLYRRNPQGSWSEQPESSVHAKSSSKSISHRFASGTCMTCATRAMQRCVRQRPEGMAVLQSARSGAEGSRASAARLCCADRWRNHGGGAGTANQGCHRGNRGPECHSAKHCQRGRRERCDLWRGSDARGSR